MRRPVLQQGAEARASWVASRGRAADRRRAESPSEAEGHPGARQQARPGAGHRGNPAVPVPEERPEAKTQGAEVEAWRFRSRAAGAAVRPSAPSEEAAAALLRPSEAAQSLRTLQVQAAWGPALPGSAAAEAQTREAGRADHPWQWAGASPRRLEAAALQPGQGRRRPGFARSRAASGVVPSQDPRRPSWALPGLPGTVYAGCSCAASRTASSTH